MRKRLLITSLLIMLGMKSYSQIEFENGYFIDESNNKIECLIKNIDWKNNPTEFDYKLSSNEKVQGTTIQTVKEFGINGVSKYIRDKVKIDRSSNVLSNLSSTRNPDFNQEVLFLKVLLEGEATLFLYEGSNLTRFFYKLGDSEINQLVYKRYLVEDKIVENNYFKQQLSTQLKCKDLAIREINNLQYSKRGLERLFISYNECAGISHVVYGNKKKRDLFNLSVRPGLNYSGLEVKYSLSDLRDIDFGDNVGFRFGIEAELILPFNKNKWGIIIEPTYQYFQSEKSKETRVVSGGTIVSKVDYKSVELPLGVRHYFHLSNDSKIFVNTLYTFDFAKNSAIEFSRKDGSLLDELEVKARRNLAFGLGYKFKDKCGLEMRYNANREILSNYHYFKARYSGLHIIFGLSLF